MEVVMFSLLLCASLWQFDTTGFLQTSLPKSLRLHTRSLHRLCGSGLLISLVMHGRTKSREPSFPSVSQDPVTLATHRSLAWPMTGIMVVFLP